MSSPSHSTQHNVHVKTEGYYEPTIFDNSQKLNGRRKLIDRSYDLYEGGPSELNTHTHSVQRKGEGRLVKLRVKVFECT